MKKALVTIEYCGDCLFHQCRTRWDTEESHEFSCQYGVTYTKEVYSGKTKLSPGTVCLSCGNAATKSPQFNAYSIYRKIPDWCPLPNVEKEET